VARQEARLHQRMARLMHRENELAAREAELARRLQVDYGGNGGMGRVGSLRHDESPTPGSKRRREASASIPRDFYDRVDFGNVLSTTTGVPRRRALPPLRTNQLRNQSSGETEAGAVNYEDSDDEGPSRRPAKKKRQGRVTQGQRDSVGNEASSFSQQVASNSLFGMSDRGRTVFLHGPLRPAGLEAVAPLSMGRLPPSHQCSAAQRLSQLQSEYERDNRNKSTALTFPTPPYRSAAQQLEATLREWESNERDRLRQYQNRDFEPILDENTDSEDRESKEDLDESDSSESEAEEPDSEEYLGRRRAGGRSP
jgi:hypothetical protein